MDVNKIYQGDSLEVLKTFPDDNIDCCITSPPYWGLRDYSVEGQLGLEKTPEEYVAKMVDVFREVRRALRPEGTCWLNLGDSYSTPKEGNTETSKNPTRVTDSFKKELPRGMKPKNLVGIPWRVAFALQADGWWLRQDIIWAKPNPMPESVTDRCTKSHEYIFLLTKSSDYYYDHEAIKEDSVDKESYVGRRFRSAKAIVAAHGRPGNPNTLDKGNEADGKTYEKRNKRSVWTVTTKPFAEAHFATFPEALIEPCVKAGCPAGGIILDPFMGAGTTAVVAEKWGRQWVGIELNPKYIEIANNRITKNRTMFQ